MRLVAIVALTAVAVLWTGCDPLNLLYGEQHVSRADLGGNVVRLEPG